MSLPFVSRADVRRRCGTARAVDALESALLGGLDPDADPPRTTVQAGSGELLVMPSAAGGHLAVKLVTVGGDPRVQGICVLFDPVTLAPAAVIDGIALTTLRTSAVSALAVRHLAAPEARRLVIFGGGPQAHAHAEAIYAVRPIERTDWVGRDHDHDRAEVRDLIARADVICCAATAREPLFDGALVAPHATVVAIGSHEPEVRETDDALARRATVVVESRVTALREAGDVIAPIASGALSEGELVTLAEVVGGRAQVDRERPRLFKSTGMAWEDAVVAAAVLSGGF